MQTDLTIIVLTYNSSHIIETCLSRLNFDKYKIEVVDNASNDDSAKIVETKFPKAQLTRLNRNIGYGRGNNVALRQVDTEFALVLNPDAIIHEKDIELIIDKMKKDEEIAIAGPLILEKFPLDAQELDQKKQELQKDFRNCDQNGFLVHFVVGAASFMRMSIFKQIGFFDEKIFLYYEDDEICKRVIDGGFKNVIFPEALAFHVGGQSSQNNSTIQGAYKKSWHLKGWSKLYWKEKRGGKSKAKKLAIKLIIRYFIRSAIYLFKFEFESSAASLGAMAGSFSYLVGLNSFNSKGDSRGSF